MDYKELISDIFELECKLFLKMESYDLIKQKCDKKCLNPAERKKLCFDIHYTFIRLIKIIKNSCQDLTEEDIMFCCLTKSGLGNNVAGRGIGCISRQAVNQRKYRIKKKMKKAGCDYLFDMIFTSVD